MTRKSRDEVRNLAVIAHVDHGKTSVIDALIWQCEALERGTAEEALLSRFDPTRAKAVSLMPRLASVDYRGTQIRFLDTPHSDLGGDIDRTLRMAEGVLLIVDASEGPPPQTRFALRKALEFGLAPIVVLNKVDLPEARPQAVLQEVRDLFVDLDARHPQLNFPVLTCVAHQGICRRETDAVDQPLVALVQEIVRHVPPPRYDPEAPLQFRITALDYDDFHGRMACGRVVNGRLTAGQKVAHCRLDGAVESATVVGIFTTLGLRREELNEALPGDIVAVAGAGSIRIGETLSDTDDPRPLPAETVDEPTLYVTLSVNDSPTAGREGTRSSAAELRERLWQELLTNSAIRVDEGERPDSFDLCGRSELQLAILIEMLRREGFEMLVSRPEVRLRDVEGRRHEPMEHLVVDCPEAYVGVVTEKAGARCARLTKMVNHGGGRVRLEYRIPSRGLIGFRSEFLQDTQGSGILNHAFDGWDKWQGEISRRTTGSLIADRGGRATAHAIEHLQNRGKILIAPGDEVYTGMVVGANSRANDVSVDITKKKVRASAAEPAALAVPRLVPTRSIGLEQALEFLNADEVVEVTPLALRLRKRTLGPRGDQS